MTIAPLFISHGGPDVLINASPARHIWQAHAAKLPRPRGIVIMSAHYLALQPLVGSAAQWRTVHDFGGFPRELYRLSYPAHGDAALAQQVSTALTAAGIGHQQDPADGMDHGAWVPLLMMYPEADIPVVTLSTLPRQDAATHYRLGQALAALAAQDILIIGSGSITHNLYALGAPDTPPQPWAQAFADWVALRVQQGDVPALLDWQAQAPFARQNHPTDEHLLPLFFALGAADGKVGRSLHRGIEYASVTMDAWVFDGAGK
ncbi:DODA-type extradiol aromatic ring-opening family dioxygenase [Vogesella facilis]|uniref:DODA-type extradiol aromatic ring-opening family dioxygenase n=1 Tax=Vogesella facilis TaxID=1655232 RepID=A0ABV7RCI3_9NEIS